MRILTIEAPWQIDETVEAAPVVYRDDLNIIIWRHKNGLSCCNGHSIMNNQLLLFNEKGAVK